MNININIYEAMTNTKHQLEVADTCTGQDVIDTLLKSGKLNRTLSGNIYEYIIKTDLIINNMKLSDVGASDGDVLILVPPLDEIC